MCGAGGHHHQESADANCNTPPVLALPAHLYAQLTDAHCHIQDDRESIHTLIESWSTSTTPSDESTSVTRLLTGKVCLMGVQPSKDLGLAPPTGDQGNSAQNTNKPITIEANTASLSLNSSSHSSSSSTPIVTVSWNETDVQGDWDLVAKLAETHPDRFVPCFGIHPWFTHKYKPLEGGYKGNTIELRGVNNNTNHSNSNNITNSDSLTGCGGGAASLSSSDSPSLSFSSAFLTPVPGPGVRREAFLAMSKQLQEQMAKESREKEGGVQAETTNDNIDKPTTATALEQEKYTKEEKESEEDDSTPLDVTIPNADDARFSHYKTVLSLPTSASESYLADLSKRLPTPRALEPALQELRRQLEAHPHAVLGEIGLDRTARVPEPSFVASSSSEKKGGDESTVAPQKRITLALTSIQHQLDIVREQLKLAAALDRPVSFHCVQAYGHWHDFLIQEGRRLRQLEADKEYQIQLQQIQASGGTIPLLQPVLSPTGGVRLSKRSTARLKREARDAAWERHVASTLQETSDEAESDSDDNEGDSNAEWKLKAKATTPKDVHSIEMTPTLAAVESVASETMSAPLATPQPTYEPVLPPRLCMHSYGGSVDMLKAFTKLDHPPEIYFSFSILINGRLQERKLKELILAVPEDRLLIESDHHSHNHVDQLLVEMVLKIAEIRNWTVEETVERTARNWQRFVYGHPDQ
ncbi:hypothetical protein BGZ97_005366 [Linnemannia gamsii]|jgi:Tat protein secretion system quality control protein TatD with DNase activity|uniref:Metallo-dependent hydrolase n=1 Tax=Linnemannia gamsii TaxID=64522 RepID=A0A9P6QT71_9FUNG|nr:hypothetical protein BGZ97_005366 [Linnemannia gamsii]